MNIVSTATPVPKARSSKRGWILTVAFAVVIATGALTLVARHPGVAHRVGPVVNSLPPGPMKSAVLKVFDRFAPDAMTAFQALPPPPPVVLGINPAEIRYYSSTVPFANLLVGSEWNDSSWHRLSAERLGANGDIHSLPADGVAYRFLLVPPTGPRGFEARCTFTGSGTLSIGAVAGPVQPEPHGVRFRLVNERGKQPRPWLIVRNVDPKRPMRDLDCRDSRLDRSVRFRPEFLQTLRGFGVLRFMDWQNANANEAVPWGKRHTPAALDLDRDGVSIEDMLALTQELGADPWFVMPWNADDDYVASFARIARARLPVGRSIYVEVGNEVWNPGFPVAKQAMTEGLERKLGTDAHEAGMRRYAERTVEVMRLWEAAFAGRDGLVRVVATQHVWPHTAELVLSFRDTAKHVDALATAPYFGAILGDTVNTRDSGLRRLAVELTATMKAVGDNRRVAARYGKRYIGYEGGQGLVLPAQVALSGLLQHEPAMYALYRQYLAGWQQNSGDVLCLFNSVYRPTSWGAWGLAEWEDETPAEAPKLRAVREFMREGAQYGATRTVRR